MGVLLVTASSARAAEGLRTRRLASTSSELVVIAWFRGRRERPGGDSRVGSGRRTGLWFDDWRLGDADDRDRPGDRAVVFSSGGWAFGDGDWLGRRRLGGVLAGGGLFGFERRFGE